MWRARVGGRTLHFHLAGINNQNFIMSDEETGSWWQQVSGLAILGPLAGKRLEPIPWDEVTWAVWKGEHPGTLVLLADERMKERYAKPDWETKILDEPTVTPVDPGDPLKPRDLVVGVTAGRISKAYPWKALADQNPILDLVGGTPLMILLHPDGRSLRCFDTRIDGETLEIFLKPGTDPPVLVDAKTGSVWDFSGLAASGPLAGRRLARVSCLKDFWFDWKLYNPATRLFTAGALGAKK